MVDVDGRSGALLYPTPPWTYVTESSDPALAACNSLFEEGGRRLVALDGSRMKDAEGVLAEFADKLQFPSYFGHNWAALDECLTDLEWLPAEAYLLQIWQAQQLLENSDHNIRALLQILEKAGQEWSEAVQVGEYWDRDPVPFHSMLITESGHPLDVQKRASALGCSLPVLRT